MDTESLRQESTPAQPRVRAVTPLSLCDWPGHATSVLYLGGCNFRCPHCHNASLAWTPRLHPELDLGGVLLGLKARQAWLDGVVICGGEPTLDPGLGELVARLLGLGLPVRVDTNGSRPEVVAELLERFPDLCFAVDVKGPWARYPELTGGAVRPDEARESLGRIFALAANRAGAFLFRTTLVPGLSESDALAIQGLLPPGATLRQQSYTPPPGRKESHAPADSEARRMSGNLVHGTHLPGHP